MRIAVIGPGAVGAYFGGRLARAGEDVTFVARGAHLTALRESGLRVESVDGDFVVRPLQVTDDTATLGPVDAVLLATKGWQVGDAVAAMRSLVGRDTVIVPLLNGVEAPEQLIAAFGASHVAGGLCGLLGSIVEPGHIRNAMPRPFVTLGELDDSHSERIERLRTAFERAGVHASVAERIWVALWEKLLFVSPLGSVGAVTRAPVGVVRSLPETRALLEGAMAEIANLARSRGAPITDEAITKTLATIDGMPESATSSMHRDILAGRPSELESQVGVVVRMARSAGVEAPLHTYLYSALLPQERRARSELEFPGTADAQ